MKKKILPLLLAAVISTTAFSTPVQSLIGAELTAEAAYPVSPPTAGRKSGTYTVTGSLSVSLSCKTSGASIYYSMNGGGYKRYTKPLKLTKNTTLKFYARKGSGKSKTVTRTYNLTPKVTVSPDGGKYTGTQTVKLSAKTTGVKFYYTLDGTKPTTKSKQYTSAGIKISKSCKLRVLAKKSGWKNKYISKSFTVEGGAPDAPLLYDYTQKYGYNQLSANNKELYKKLYDCVAAHEESVNIYMLEINKETLQKVFFTMAYDNPQLFWLGTGCSMQTVGSRVYSVYPLYSKTKAEAEKLKPQIEKAAKSITDKALEEDNLFFTVLYIHDKIVNSTEYTLYGGEYIREVDGPLLKGHALCEGYAMTFAYLCQSIGIDAFCVEGYSDGDGHLWNMIKLDNKWYHIDVTFDDPVSVVPMCLYEYFCVTESEISADRYIKNPVAIPKAVYDDYNYYAMMGIKTYRNADEAYNSLIKQSAENFDKGIMKTEVRCASGTVAEKVYGWLSASIFTDLAKYGCSPAGASIGSVGNTVYIELR